ncbi:unnamed protein product [Rotaria sp. Silwood1]|nr:unnamed protein product [Rotaria sp. Silwood1]CAF1631092.1 unnamed protein product [Rotaria sp. Silwood1]CAF3808718.1 unnamed protein product [Rotaria sp. Silwood1]CAF3824926.1 unnamed protein product [Rotaria sp. Silwood1]CAF4757747.1 unnamed protein product [Rotaria sp. Silwood1]
MITVPLNPNSVHIPMINIGCCKSKFDSTYPIHLNGIISKQDFHKSISRINRTISSNKILIFLSIIFCVSIMGGIIVLHHLSHEFLTIGMILIISESILFGIGCYIIKLQRIIRMRHAIAEESMIYSSRSPIPCSWRLDTMTHFVGRYGIYRNNHLGYHSSTEQETLPKQVGNKTECSLLDFVGALDGSYDEIPTRYSEEKFVHVYTFDQ